MDQFNPVWVYVVSFVDLFAVSLSIPLLSTHLRSLGASHILIGFASSLYAGTQLISGPLVGSWSDQNGRQAILLMTLAICTICYIFLGFVKSLLVVVIIRAGLGVFKHIQVLSRTIIADQVSVSEHSRVSGRLTAISSAGFIVGPAIGGHVTELENGFTYLCYCTSVLCTVNVAITYLLLHDRPKPQPLSGIGECRELTMRNDVNMKEELLRAVPHLGDVDWTIYWHIFALKFLLSISQAIFTANYFVRVQETYGVSPKWVGYTICFQGLVSVSAGLLAGWVDAKLYKNDSTFRKRNFHGFVVISLSFMGLFFSPTLALFMVWNIPLRASSSLLRIVGTDMVLKRCPPTQRGSLVGTGNSITNIARLVAPLLAGITEDLYGTSSAILLSVIMSAFGLIISMMIGRYKSIQSKDDCRDVKISVGRDELVSVRYIDKCEYHSIALRTHTVK